jgi:hypothetical protein
MNATSKVKTRLAELSKREKSYKEQSSSRSRSRRDRSGKENRNRSMNWEQFGNQDYSRAVHYRNQQNKKERHRPYDECQNRANRPNRTEEGNE